MPAVTLRTSAGKNPGQRLRATDYDVRRSRGILPRMLACAALSFIAAAAPIHASAFAWTVDPAKVVLGDTETVQLVLTAKAKNGAPLEDALPRVTTSVGAVTVPEWTAPGTWKLTLALPTTETLPQVAILVATMDSRSSLAVGVLSVPLWGKGKSVVRTKPNSIVSLKVGSDTFGPVTADADGRAVVPIVVPPGAAKGKAMSKDEAGNESEASIDLGIPPFNRAALGVVDDAAIADGTGVARFVAVVVDERGAPVVSFGVDPHKTLRAKATVGTVAIVATGEPGIALLELSPGKTKQAKSDVDITVDGLAASSAKGSVELIAGQIARAEIALEKDVLTADDVDREVRAEVQLVDDAGRPTLAPTVGVSVDAGRVKSVTASKDDRSGPRTVAWLLPDRSQPEPATLSVTLPGGKVLGTASLALRPGKPVKLAFDRVPPMVADGESALELTLRATDRFGVAVAPVGALVEMDDGRISDITVQGETAIVRVVPNAVDERRALKVNAGVAALAANVEVQALPKPAVASLLGASLAVGSNYEDIVAIGPELSALVRLPLLEGTVAAGGSVALLQALTNPPRLADHRAIPVMAELAWRPPFRGDFDLHFGVAAGFILVDAVPRNQTKHLLIPSVGGQAVLGVVWRLGPGALEIMGRGGTATYFDDFLGNDGNGEPVLDADVQLPVGAALTFGYRLIL